MSFSFDSQLEPDGTVLVTLKTAVATKGRSSSDDELEELLKRCPKDTRVIARGDSKIVVDSLLVSFLFCVAKGCATHSLVFSIEGFPPQVDRQLALALSVPERKGAKRSFHRDSIIETIGKSAVSLKENLTGWLEFVGELVVALSLFIRRRARVPVRDIWVTMDECGPGALPIVTLISSLVGVILAFIGAQQLRQFGAQIYVANLVSVAMLREMGAVMAGVIMAGRTGAAFAAQLGTMQVNEEIDALKTLGISPMQYLVVPRVLALIVMMPLLCLYADALGILGGAFVSALTMDISFVQFFNQAATAAHLADVWLGVLKSCVFGVLIAIAGCLSGIRCGRSASAVGVAVTSSVVSGIVAIVLSDAVFAVITEVLGL